LTSIGHYDNRLYLLSNDYVYLKLYINNINEQIHLA
jgi:hypothetical protein